MVPQMIQFFNGPNRGAVSIAAGSTYSLAVSEHGVYLHKKLNYTFRYNYISFAEIARIEMYFISNLAVCRSGIALTLVFPLPFCFTFFC